MSRCSLYSLIVSVLFLYHPMTTYGVETQESKHQVSTVVEAGPSYKVFGAKEDNKKIINSYLMQNFGLLFHQLNLGGWIGGTKTGGVFSYNVGIKSKYFGAYGGYSYFSEKNDSIGTHWGFSLGAYTELNQVMIGFKHYSNGAKAFDHDKKPNYGLNFITLGVHV